MIKDSHKCHWWPWLLAKLKAQPEVQRQLQRWAASRQCWQKYLTPHLHTGATQTKGNNLALVIRDPFPTFTKELSSFGLVFHKLKADPCQWEDCRELDRRRQGQRGIMRWSHNVNYVLWGFSARRTVASRSIHEDPLWLELMIIPTIHFFNRIQFQFTENPSVSKSLLLTCVCICLHAAAELFPLWGYWRRDRCHLEVIMKKKINSLLFENQYEQ